MKALENAPQQIKIAVEQGTVWGVVVTGWLTLLQPWLTAMATVLAIAWTTRQLYVSYKKDK